MSTSTSLKPEHVDDLVKALDDSGEPWELRRHHEGVLWVVRRGESSQDPAARTFESESLCEVLELALASPRLPVIPRRPRISHYDMVKRGDGQRKWKVRCDGAEMYHLTRKRDAESAVERCRAASRKALEDWERDHLVFVMSHVEEVDFYWAD